MRRSAKLTWVVVVAAFSLAAAAARDGGAGTSVRGGGVPLPVYAVTDLGSFGGTYSRAEGINVFGQAAGTASLPGEGCCTTADAFLYSRGSLLHLPVAPPSDALDVNDLGQVVGTTGGDGFLWDRGRVTLLKAPGGGETRPAAISDAGWVVGGANAASPPYCFHAFLYRRGTFSDLGTLGGEISQAFDVDIWGDVVGGAYPKGVPCSQANSAHAFLWRGGVMTDLGTLGGSYSEAYGINIRRQVVGVSRGAGDMGLHAFLWDRGRMVDLGALANGNTEAYAINDLGQIVGSSTVAAVDHAFLYSGGAMRDLNSLIPPGSGWVLYQATDVNDLGQVVGTGFRNGEQHAYLLTPARGGRR